MEDTGVPSIRLYDQGGKRDHYRKEGAILNGLAPKRGPERDSLEGFGAENGGG